MKRVVITGLGVIAPLGDSVSSLVKGIAAGRSAVQYMEGWDQYIGLRSLVGAPAELRNEKDIPRKSRRSMSRMSIFAVQATQQALRDAGGPDSVLGGGRLGCIIGSTMGSASAINDSFEAMLPSKDLNNMTSMQFFRCISHTAVMNVAQYLGITGTVIAPSAACASALQAVGLGYEQIRLGRQDLVVCGGAEELHPTVTGSFDVLFATSSNYNGEPGKTPRPFDKDRDGLVCGEGSGVVVLEDYERARSRGVKIYAEVLGTHTCSSGAHVSQSDRVAMIRCMKAALADAGISQDEVDYVNAHATATLQGDVEEAAAIRNLFGADTPVSSFKGHIGHTLGASGTIELIVSLAMMECGQVLPTRNLESIDPDCAGIDHVTENRAVKIHTMLKNSFAFGGINAALVCRRIPE